MNIILSLKIYLNRTTNLKHKEHNLEEKIKQKFLKEDINI